MTEISRPLELWADSSSTEQKLTLFLFLPPELSFFKGHFPEWPLLPAVAQLELALQYLSERLDDSLVFSGGRQMKFTRPLQPEDCVRLELELNAQKQSLNFKYSILKGLHDLQKLSTLKETDAAAFAALLAHSELIDASEGRINLCRAA